LRNLIAEGLIADGEVDDRSITEVAPEDLKGFDQCHFFAGIGGWSYAARLAGWPDDRPIWTGSPPCQPFSVAGKRQGTDDQRHLWPVWFDLVRECRPPVIFGEQVSAAIRYGWLDSLQEDLEASDYAFGSVIVPASGVGAPHKRDRLWFVAHSISQGSQGWLSGRQDQGREVEHRYPRCGSAANSMAYTESQRESSDESGQDCGDREFLVRARPWGNGIDDGSISRTVYCKDGKRRLIPTEPEIFPLANGIPNRVGILRGAGNAIVPQVAAEIISCLTGADYGNH
jgi:DNA (cytosine-5)-methyltransferase 1